MKYEIILKPDLSRFYSASLSALTKGTPTITSSRELRIDKVFTLLTNYYEGR